MENKSLIKVEKSEKKHFNKSCWGCCGGVFGPSKGPKQFISRWLRPNFFSQNENPQRWIDSQLNSESFKTDFKLK